MRDYVKISRLVLAVVLCMTTAISCDNKTTDTSSETAESSSVVSEAETSASAGENDVSKDFDVSDIPEGAAYKCTEYIVTNDEPTVSSISYYDANGNVIRSFSYMGNELLYVSDLENEYDSDGRLVSIKQKSESFNEYVDSDESSTEFEYYENGDIKKMCIYWGDETRTVEFVYEYDDDGRAVAAKEYWDGSDEFLSTTYRTYDENGNVITENIKFEHNGLETHFTYEYDDKGRPLIKKDVDSEYYYTKYEYEDYD